MIIASNLFLVVLLLLLLLLKAVGVFVPEYLFATASFIALIPVILNVIKALREKELTIDFLALIALSFSLYSHEWYSATFINLMLSCARIFDEWTNRRTKNIIQSLLKFRPDKVKLKIDGQYKIINIKDVKVDDLIIIETGDRIPVDGIIVDGVAQINESTLTGESLVKTKRKGDKVYSSTLNENGGLTIKCLKIESESTLSKIIDLVEKSSLKKSKIIKIVTKFTKWYIVITLVGSVIIYFATGNLLLILSILLVVCADDIAVSVPLAFTASIARAAKMGILIKSSDVLEKLSKLKIIITDKTGTLTFGKPIISGVKIFNGFSKNEFLESLSLAESSSSHPIAKPILEYTKNNNISLKIPDKFDEKPGEGITVCEGKLTITAGKIDFLRDTKIKINDNDKKKVDEIERKGFSVTGVAINNEFAGIVYFEDKIRPRAKDVIKKTIDLGVEKWVMLTGDNEVVAKRVATEVGIGQFETNLKPEDKITKIEEIKAKNEGKSIAMIGDGVNDAAALAMSDVGFAMGAIGSDTAIDASDVALMHDNLMKVPEAMILGKATDSIVIQNFIIWGVSNVIGLFLVFANILGPTGAATYNFLTDFLPIFNALRIGAIKIKTT